jgi:hypothetical protein
MKGLLRSIYQGVKKDLGFPVSLEQLLHEHPGVGLALAPPMRSIAFSSVVRWQEFGRGLPTGGGAHRNGTLQGRRIDTDGRYVDCSVHRAELDVLVLRDEVARWQCDIGAIDGFSRSRSRLRSFGSTDEFAESCAPELIERVDEARLFANLAHGDVRILHDAETTDYFCYHAWDSRLFLMNAGGSHRVAAAKYLARRLGMPVPLHGKLVTFRLNPSAIDSLGKDFAAFAISGEPQRWREFEAAVESTRASWFWLALPHPYKSGRAVFLPRSDARAMRVAQVLHDAEVADLIRHLAEIAGAQHRLSA